jgi:hypothetical protein
MKNIETINELEKEFDVQIGDLVICTHNSYPHAPDYLEIAIGLYNPYQGVNGGPIGPSHVDFFENAIQRPDLVKSNDYFRIHLMAGSDGKKEKLGNNAGFQTQIPVKQTKTFEIILKAKDVSDFYRESAQK